MLFVLGMAASAVAAEPPCERPTVSVPLVPNFRAVLDGCHDANCALRPITVDARFDDLLYGSQRVTPAAMRTLSETFRQPPYLVDVRERIRSRSYRRAFAAYRAELMSPHSLSRELEILETPDMARLESLLGRASAGPLTTQTRALLSQLCAAHPRSKQLRLYAALDRLEQNDARGALLTLLTVPYVDTVASEVHYDGMDTAALAQALAIDARAAASALAALRSRIRHGDRHAGR